MVGKLGAASITADELKAVLNTKTQTADVEIATGYLPEEETILAIQDAKEQGQSVVLVSGNFDLLTEAHIDYLQQAKSLGDRLVVAIADDMSVRQKNKQHLVHRLALRASVLASIEVVDWVVSYSEKTPEHLIEKLEPDVLVRGLNDTHDAIAGSESVTYNQGLVHDKAPFAERVIIEHIAAREAAPEQEALL